MACPDRVFQLLSMHDRVIERAREVRKKNRPAVA